MRWHRRALGFTIAALSLPGLAVAGLADTIQLPPPGSNTTGGPTTGSENQELTALSGARAPDPYYEPKGIPLGGPFRLFPNLFSSLGYDDNVYRATDGAKVASPVWEIDPTLILDYDIERLRLDAYAQGGYQSLNQYNLLTYNGGLQGQYEISHDAMFAFNASDGLFYEAYQSANTNAIPFASAVIEKRPNEYYLIDASGKFSYKPNRLGVSAGGSFDSYAFTSTPLNTLPSTKQFFGFRNADIVKGWVEGSYDFSPGYSLFVRGTYNTDNYSHLDNFSNPPAPPPPPPPPCAMPSVNCINHSSHGYSFDGGLNLLLGDLAQGEIYAGWIDQFYDRNQPIHLKDISGVDFGANVTWYPTELLTVHLAGARQIENTIFVSTAGAASGGDDRNGTLTLDYELLRRVHVNGNVGYDDVNYRGGGREDKTLSGGIGAKWLMSHNVWLSANYEYSNRSSAVASPKVPSGRYVDNFFSVGLNLQD